MSDEQLKSVPALITSEPFNVNCANLCAWFVPITIPLPQTTAKTLCAVNVSPLWVQSVQRNELSALTREFIHKAAEYDQSTALLLHATTEYCHFTTLPLHHTIAEFDHSTILSLHQRIVEYILEPCILFDSHHKITLYVQLI